MLEKSVNFFLFQGKETESDIWALKYPLELSHISYAHFTERKNEPWGLGEFFFIGI